MRADSNFMLLGCKHKFFVTARNANQVKAKREEGASERERERVERGWSVWRRDEERNMDLELTRSEIWAGRPPVAQSCL